MLRHRHAIRLRGRLVAAVIATSLVAVSAAYAAHSVRETYQSLLGQVNSGQVKSALLVAKKHEARVRLANGQHFIAVYPADQQQQLLSTLRAHGAAAHVHRAKTSKSSGHIRYRYIALAILALGALAAVGYYLLRGRPSAVPAATTASTGAEVTAPPAAPPADPGPASAPERAPPPAPES